MGVRGEHDELTKEENLCRLPVFLDELPVFLQALVYRLGNHGRLSLLADEFRTFVLDLFLCKICA